MTYNWFVSSNTSSYFVQPTMNAKRRLLQRLGFQQDEAPTVVVDIKDGSDEQWTAETRLDNGARFQAGPYTSETALREVMAECELRWSTPENSPRSDAKEREHERHGEAETAVRLLSRMTDEEIVAVVNRGKDRRGLVGVFNA